MAGGSASRGKLYFVFVKINGLFHFFFLHYSNTWLPFKTRKSQIVLGMKKTSKFNALATELDEIKRLIFTRRFASRENHDA